MENKKRALGRGLEQLFNNENLDLDSIERNIYETAKMEEIIDIKIEELRPNPYQPRTIFNEDALIELSKSIKEHGVFQPIIVKKSIKGYEIVAGERRVRASKMAGLSTVPAIIRPFSDEKMMEIALLENLQRENLNVIEEAKAYKLMLERLLITQDELSKKVGKSRSHITNILGILRLPSDVQNLILERKITMGHARALSKLESNDEIINLANRIVENSMPVRELEQTLENDNVSKKVKINRVNGRSNEFKYVEDLITDKLDTKVKIKDKKIEIGFSNIADLNRILEILGIRE